jgi:hypothetical protein
MLSDGAASTDPQRCLVGVRLSDSRSTREDGNLAGFCRRKSKSKELKPKSSFIHKLHHLLLMRGLEPPQPCEN